MTLEFHWIGSTGNSIDKYDWNVAKNWLSYNIGAVSSSYSIATRVPQAGDIVKIGDKFHCFSPLLFGGYTGGLTHNSGSWGVAGGITSTTAGATSGGVSFEYSSDQPATTFASSASVILISNINSLNQRNPSAFWQTVAQNERDFITGLEEVNPHLEETSATGAATYKFTDSLYPFPYLGGGLTGEILDWVYNQHKTSYEAFAAAGNASYAAANAWIGGGATGTLTPRTQELRIRARKVAINPGNNVTPGDVFNNPRSVNIKVNPDREPNGGTIVTTINVYQPHNTQHQYIIGNSVARQINIVGDSTVELAGVTAAHVDSEMHSTLKVDRNCSIGGIRINTGRNEHRYNVWPLYFSGQITAGAVSAVWGSFAQTIPVSPFANTITVDPAPANLVGTGLTSDVPTNNLSPYIGIGEYLGGTASFATIPSLNVNSAPEGVAPSHSLQFIGSARIGEVNLNGGEFSPSVLLTQGVDSEIYIGSLNISKKAKVYFNRNPDFDSLFMGGITGTNPSNFRLIGGINALDSSCVIYPDTGIRLVNTKILAGGEDASGKKNNTFATVAREDLTSLQAVLNIEPPQAQLD